MVEAASGLESYEHQKLGIGDSGEDKKFFEAADLSVDCKAWADGKNVSPLNSRTLNTR